MQPIGLTQNNPVRLPVKNETLVIANHPSVAVPALVLPLGSSLPAGYVLVGFDRLPTTARYDAVVPPFSEVRIAIPPGTQIATLVWPSDYLANPFLVPGGAILPLLVDWTCQGAGTQQLDLLPSPPTSQYSGWNDRRNAEWSPSKWTGVLDQGVNTGAVYQAHLRPAVAPSQAITVTGLLVANTLTDLAGVQGSIGGLAGTVLKRLIISASAAGLIVIGTNGLTVGAPGAQEVVRVNAAAAGVLPPIDFGEGLELNFSGVAGVWRYYASTAITVDITAILG